MSSGDRFNVALAEPTSPKSPSVASPKKYDAAPSGRDAKRVSCPLGLPLDSGKDQGEDVELRKSKGAISSLTITHLFLLGALEIQSHVSGQSADFTKKILESSKGR